MKIIYNKKPAIINLYLLYFDELNIKNIIPEPYDKVKNPSTKLIY